MPVLTSGGVKAASANGVLGDPRGASAAEGEALLATLVDDLHGELMRWKPDERGRLR
jgi:creatinine amidohydrolase